MKSNLQQAYRCVLRVSTLLAVLLTTPSVFGQSANNDQSTSSTTTAAPPSLELEPPETIVVLGRPVNTARIGGSAHVVDTEALSDFEYDDVQRVLMKIPGVYVRDEDGFGLRPNIGLRGANSDRSSRVVLMEDDVLLGPAPYSAPAAYFTPLLTRMESIEVFKGPAAIRFGPYTVGGAINFWTADIPDGHAGKADVAVGQFGYSKLHGRYGWGGTNVGFVVEGVRLASNGFKELDGNESADTGFIKNEVMAKARLNSDSSARVYHRLDIKAGYADEGSNETYLGLTDEDFDANPVRRYRASQLARMNWERTQAQLSYSMSVDDDFKLKLVAYRHDFSRAWLKLNRFRNLEGTVAGDVNVDRVLTEPTGRNLLLLRMARGEVGSADIRRNEQDPEANLLGIGTNDRSFVSQGIQLTTELTLGEYDFINRIRAGARLHYDEIKRRHDEAPYEMVVLGDGQPGSVVRVGDIEPTLTNDESALAIALYVQDEMTILEDLIVTPGVRAEIISTTSDRRRDDNPDQDELSNSDFILIPGVGVFYGVLDWLGIVAGVHRGFSPVAPGQVDAIEPETSWNYEAGLRYRRNGTQAEVIGFFSDYSNLLLTCSFSGGCPDGLNGVQFNAGDVSVYGLEASARHIEYFGSLELGVDVAYTLTESRFQNAFTSGSPQFERVEVDDRLPYVPIHQLSATLGLGMPVLGALTSLSVSYTFVDRMRNVASQGDVPDIQLTDAQHVVDATLQSELTEGARLYLRVDNLLNRQYIASRRPFGARPGKPFQLQLGFTYSFGG